MIDINNIITRIAIMCFTMDISKSQLIEMPTEDLFAVCTGYGFTREEIIVALQELSARAEREQRALIEWNEKRGAPTPRLTLVPSK